MRSEDVMEERLEQAALRAPATPGDVDEVDRLFTGGRNRGRRLQGFPGTETFEGLDDVDDGGRKSRRDGRRPAGPHRLPGWWPTGVAGSTDRREPGR